MILVRLFLVNHYFTFNFPEDSRSALPLWQMVAVAYLAGTVLLLMMILVNVAEHPAQHILIGFEVLRRADLQPQGGQEGAKGVEDGGVCSSSPRIS